MVNPYIRSIMATVNNLALAHAELEKAMYTEFEILEQTLISSNMCTIDDLVALKEKIESEDPAMESFNAKIEAIQTAISKLDDELSEQDRLSNILVKLVRDKSSLTDSECDDIRNNFPQFADLV